MPRCAIGAYSDSVTTSEPPCGQDAAAKAPPTLPARAPRFHCGPSRSRIVLQLGRHGAEIAGRAEQDRVRPLGILVRGSLVEGILPGGTLASIHRPWPWLSRRRLLAACAGESRPRLPRGIGRSGRERFDTAAARVVKTISRRVGSDFGRPRRPPTDWRSADGCG